MDYTTSIEEPTTSQIEDLLTEYKSEIVPTYNKLWAYYRGKNTAILSRPDSEPDNKTPFPYARKIINTFTGYGYRPGFIKYRPVYPEVEPYFQALNELFRANNEPIKTEQAGRSTGIFGVAYELHYIDRMVNDQLSIQAQPRFFPVDPRQMIIMYDETPEPEPMFAIRFFKSGDATKVEVYTKSRIIQYRRELENYKPTYTLISEQSHFYDQVPVSVFKLGDDSNGLIEPIIPQIDNYDLIVSDSMIEFGRFANAYLRLVGMGMSDQVQGQNKTGLAGVLQSIKKRRVFERLKSPDDVTFLTKDIPTQFIDFMTKLLKEEIHVQSHVPDFTSPAFSGALSGAAIERLLFDFENVVSSAQAEFDIGLYQRIELISTIMRKAGQPVSDAWDINITHDRNIPLDVLSEAQQAEVLRRVGISMQTVLEDLPDSIIPDVETELERQSEERNSRLPSLDELPDEAE